MANTPTNKAWDTDKDFSTQISHNFNDLSISLATKESGYYSSLPSPTGMTIFPEDNRGKQPLRKYIDIGALPAAGTSTTAHGLVFTKVIRIYGVANNTTAKIHMPIPYASATANKILELYADVTNINIVVGKDMSAYTAYVCIEYLES